MDFEGWLSSQGRERRKGVSLGWRGRPEERQGWKCWLDMPRDQQKACLAGVEKLPHGGGWEDWRDFSQRPTSSRALSVWPVGS